MLPHLRSVGLNELGSLASCGAAADVCLDSSDAITRTFVGMTQDEACTNRWYRMQTTPEGGSTFEWFTDGGVPWPWVDGAGCHDKLSWTRGRDAAP